ncbi:hypothetical protein D3C87_1275920 [compost metagenome]
MCTFTPVAPPALQAADAAAPVTAWPIVRVWRTASTRPDLTPTSAPVKPVPRVSTLLPVAASLLTSGMAASDVPRAVSGLRTVCVPSVQLRAP